MSAGRRLGEGDDLPDRPRHVTADPAGFHVGGRTIRREPPVAALLALASCVERDRLPLARVEADARLLGGVDEQMLLAALQVRAAAERIVAESTRTALRPTTETVSDRVQADRVALRSALEARGVRALPTGRLPPGALSGLLLAVLGRPATATERTTCSRCWAGREPLPVIVRHALSL